MKTIKPVSENVKKIEYNDKVMKVTFHSGAVYRYKNVSSQKFTAFKNADSVGAYAATRLEGGERIK